eukprot:376525-Amphidinium_carterae.1
MAKDLGQGTAQSALLWRASTGRQRVVGMDDDSASFSQASVSSDERELQEDDAALTGVAVGLFKALTADEHFQSMVSHTDLQDLAVPIREFLSGFFDGSVWPEMHIKQAASGPALEQLFQLVLEVVKKESVPLGEDILVHAFQVIARHHTSDPRAKSFRYHVESLAVVR